MPHTKGACIGGVRTIEDLKSRCKVAPDEDAFWLWLKSIDKRGTPKLWFSEFGATVTIGSVICWLTTGERPKSGVVWYQHCDCRSCANPAHWRAGSIGAAMRRRPRRNPALHRAKVTAARRAQSRITPEIAEQIRASDGVLKAIAERFGMSKSAVGRIRSGETWSPVVLPGNSVFNLGG